MAKSGNTGTTRQNGQRVDVFFGTLTKKVKGKSQTRAYIIRVAKRVQEELNLPLATIDQLSRKEGEKEILLPGSVGAKSIIVRDPQGNKTASGKSVKTHSVPVPGNATVKEIREFLRATKAEKFAIKGGRSYGVPGKTQGNT